MKQFLALITALLLCLSLAACSSGGTEPAAENKLPQTTVDEVVEKLQEGEKLDFSDYTEAQKTQIEEAAHAAGLDVSVDDHGTASGTPAQTTPGGATNPGTTDPGATDPGTTDPGTTDPGTTDPGTTDPGGVDLGDGEIPYDEIPDNPDE